MWTSNTTISTQSITPSYPSETRALEPSLYAPTQLLICQLGPSERQTDRQSQFCSLIIENKRMNMVVKSKKMPYKSKIHKAYLSETHVSPLFHDAPILEQICQPCLSELRTFHQSRFYNLS